MPAVPGWPFQRLRSEADRAQLLIPWSLGHPLLQSLPRRQDAVDHGPHRILPVAMPNDKRTADNFVPAKDCAAHPRPLSALARRTPSSFRIAELRDLRAAIREAITLGLETARCTRHSTLD